MNINKLLTISLLLFGCCLSANADVWKWFDANGDIHFVDTTIAIYTWQDDDGKVHFSDRKGEDGAVAVELIWHSTGWLHPENEMVMTSRNAYSGEPIVERFEYKKSETDSCKHAQEVYDFFLKAQRLYKTGEDGERVYLSEEESIDVLAKTKAGVEQQCT